MTRSGNFRLALFAAMLILIVLAPVAAKGTQETKSDVVTIQFSMWDAIPENNNFIARFMEKNPDIKVEVVNIPDTNYSQKLNTMVATDTAPDVMLVWECDLPVFANGGKLVPLGDYMAQSASFRDKTLIPAVRSIQNVSGGATYGLPWCYASEILYYNRDMFDAKGIPYPDETWTWDDFVDAARRLTVVKNGVTTQWGADDITFKGIWYSMAGAGGDAIVDSNGKMQIDEGARAALQMQYDLVNTYKTSPAPSASSAGSDLFIAGRAAMTRAGSWMCSAYRDITDFDWDIAPLPKGERHYSTLHTGFFTIAKNSEHPEAAWRFIEFCMSEEGQQMISSAYNNPSAIMEYAEKGAYRVQGERGPSSWEAFDQTAQFGEFGYVLAPSGLTDDIVKKFQAAVLGQISIDQAITDSQKLIAAIED